MNQNDVTQKFRVALANAAQMRTKVMYTTAILKRTSPSGPHDLSI